MAGASPPRPILLVASDGGGARGSYWTAIVLDCAIAARAPAKATTGTADREVNGGVRDCLESVAEELTARQVMPFLRRLASAGG